MKNCSATNEIHTEDYHSPHQITEDRSTESPILVTSEVLPELFKLLPIEWVSVASLDIPSSVFDVNTAQSKLISATITNHFGQTINLEKPVKPILIKEGTIIVVHKSLKLTDTTPKFLPIPTREKHIDPLACYFNIK